jgi:hypothetical protein
MAEKSPADSSKDADTNEAYHPRTSPEFRIGTVVQRYPDLNIALVKLNDNIQFSNRSYFEAPIPKKIGDTNRGVAEAGMAAYIKPWLFAESPYTGLVPFLCAGWRDGVTITNPDHGFHHYKFDAEYILRSANLNLGVLREGISGSPMVIDNFNTSANQGTVLGFFTWTDGNIIENASVPVLGELIVDGWEIVSLL